MAKKGKRNIKALLEKRAQLQELESRPTLSIPGAPKLPVSSNEPAVVSSSEPAPTQHHTGREIWRTLIATGVIAVVLIAVVIVDQQKPFLTGWGSTMYTGLRLNQ